MARSTMKIDRNALETSHRALHDSAKHAKKKTHDRLTSTKKLGSTAGHGLFATFIDGVIDQLAAHLPDDIEALIESYGNALLDIETGTTGADHWLSRDATASGGDSKTPRPGPTRPIPSINPTSKPRRPGLYGDWVQPLPGTGTSPYQPGKSN